jgi:hypothetical protein
VQVHYGEGLAIHTGPKPCVGPREGAGEASAGEFTGQPLSRESKIVPGADVVRITEGNMDGASSRVPARPLRSNRRLLRYRVTTIEKTTALLAVCVYFQAWRRAAALDRRQQKIAHRIGLDR